MFSTNSLISNVKKSVEELKVRELPEDLAIQLSVLEDIVFANEIANELDDERSIQKAIVSYFAIGESSHILPTIRLLESRRSSGGWDPAANAILPIREKSVSLPFRGGEKR